jgi:hypothetical protein
MSSDAWLPLVFVMLALVLPVMALRRRELAANKLIKLTLIWVVIFAGVAGVIALITG